MSNHTMIRTEEVTRSTWSGYPVGGVGLALVAFGIWLLAHAADAGNTPLLPLASVIAGSFLLSGIYQLQPNTAAILLLFGHYRGTDRGQGLRWANPFYRKQRISLRAHNLASDKLKVNDKRGNPIEIASAIVWRVRDTAQASFDVENYEQYVRVQAEAAVRHLASTYAYDEGEDLAAGEITLRAGQDRIAESLVRELTDRFDLAGVVVEDAKLTHLAYAPEIAQVMLRRQQAEAIIAARSKIVHGAVSMVEMALKGLSERDIVHLDDDRRATMVSNLLVVLCSETEAQPVINAGTLYG